MLRVLTAGLVAALVAWAVPTIAQAAPPSQARRACVAMRWDGAFGLGHVGWGIEIAPGQFLFGGLEGLPSTAGIRNGDPNGGWYALGSWNDMVNHFVDPGLRNSQPRRAGGVYDQMKCTELASSQPAAARKVGMEMARRGYALSGNNCLDATDEVVKLFGASTPRPGKVLTPKAYYDRLKWRITVLRRDAGPGPR